MKFQMTEPGQNAGIALAEDIIGYIFKYGVPKKIIFRNLVTGSVLVDICEICGIYMDVNRNLEVIDNFLLEFRRFKG